MMRSIHVLAAALAVSLIGCASGPVKLADKDTSGAFDGEWVANVRGPTMDQVRFPGNFRMACEWSGFIVPLVVEDGLLRRSGDDVTTPVAADGRFMLRIPWGEAARAGGILPGNNPMFDEYRGELFAAEAGIESEGEYMLSVPSLGGRGCSSTMVLSRKTRY